MSDFVNFYRHMTKFYKGQRDALEAQNEVLWQAALTLTEAILNSESDGSGITDLKVTAQIQAESLEKLLTLGAH